MSDVRVDAALFEPASVDSSHGRLDLRGYICLRVLESIFSTDVDNVVLCRATRNDTHITRYVYMIEKLLRPRNHE